MRSYHPLLLVPLFALVAPLNAQAAETGQIRGKVVDDKGAPVAGAEVTLSGSGIAGEVKETTQADGTFRFVTVPPGTHELLVVGTDAMQPQRLEVDVRLDEATFVPVTLKAASDAEVVTVEAALPVVDTTRSSFSTEMGDELLQSLPVGRSYQDAVNMLPGVYGRVDTDQGGPGDGNPSVRGEGQYGNNYTVDGISTRDPATKTFGTNVNFDAIQDIQVYTDGAPAEFGDFGGMVVNVVTKDGGDEHHGTAGYWLTTDASGGTYDTIDYESHTNTPHPKRDFLTHEFSGTAGGPIVKEKLWYFVAGGLGADSEVFEGMDPNAPYHERSANGLAKISWFITPDLTLRYTFNGSWLNIANEQTSSLTATEAQSQRLDYDGTHLLTATFHPDALTEVELKAGTLNSHLDVIPQSDDKSTPAVLNQDTGILSGNWTDYDLNKRGRWGGSLNVTRVLQNAGGDHRIKAGLEYWQLHDARQVEYTGPEGGRKYFADNDHPCTADSGYSDCSGYFQYRESGWLGHTAKTLGMFLQDDWSPIDALTLNLGVREDNEKDFQNSGVQLRVGDLPGLHLDPSDPDYIEPYSDKDTRKAYNPWMTSPRLGLAWDVTGDNKTKVSANLGRYYDVNGTDFLQWGDTRSESYFETWDATGDPNDPYVQTYVQDPAGNPLIYDENLKPPHMDKLALAIEREVLPLLSISVRGIVSKTVDLPEDEDFDLNTWIIVNPADANGVSTKRRDYKALELTATRRFDDHWQLLASYTLSSSKGHAPGQFERSTGGDFGSNGNNVGVYLDDVNDYQPDDVPQDYRDAGGLSRKEYFDYGYGWLLDGLNGLGTTKNDAGWYGYLPYHSFHQLKINGSYTFTDGTTIGVVYEFDSGHAWQKRTWVDLYADYSGFGEGRGTRFMPPVNYVDVRVSHEFDLDNERKLELSVDAFNLPDFKTPISYYENDNENFGLVLYRQAPRAVRAGLKLTY